MRHDPTPRANLVGVISAALFFALAAFAVPGVGIVLFGISVFFFIIAAVLFYNQNKQDTGVQPPATLDQYPDLDESFTYQRRPPSSYVPPTDPNAYPDLNQSFTYQSSRPPDRGQHRTPLSYPGDNDNMQRSAPQPPPPTEIGGHTIYQHALEAIEATESGLDKSQPVPIDIGLLVYRGAEKPTIHRTFAVPMDSDYIQPYMQLYVPLPTLLNAAVGRVRMEIQNPNDDLLFQHEADYTLKPGLNLITPPARLPVKDAQHRDDLWQMRVSVGGRVLAWHTFDWSSSAPQEMVTAVGNDGEISEELHHLLEQQVVETLSLDDLLAGDDDKGVKRA